jgi:uncharacterized membrane protein
MKKHHKLTNSLLEDSPYREVHQVVHQTIVDESLITRRIVETETDTDITFGNRLADRVAEFGGSWKFILLFSGFLFVWIVFNSVAWLLRFDPFPFILLNLILSCLAAVQAPIIMMSQNRQEAKDRQRARNDYAVNLKSEIEIQCLHEKLDILIKEVAELRQRNAH